MTRRILPPEEWPRLDGNEQLGSVWRVMDPLTASILVVEDEGEIVGCWAFLHVLHAEGAYVAPHHRKAAAVARHLWIGARELAMEQGAAAVWTGADKPQIAELVLRHGGTKFPVDSYVLPLVRGES